MTNAFYPQKPHRQDHRRGALLLLLVCALALVMSLAARTAGAQVPDAAQGLATWQPAQPIEVYNDGGDTLTVYNDSVWVAVQGPTVTVGSPFGVPAFTLQEFAAQADSVVRFNAGLEPLQSMYQTIDLYRQVRANLE